MNERERLKKAIVEKNMEMKKRIEILFLIKKASSLPSLQRRETVYEEYTFLLSFCPVFMSH